MTGRRGAAAQATGEERGVRQGEAPDTARSNKAVLRSPAALDGIAVILAVSMSAEVVNLVFGVWLGRMFGISSSARPRGPSGPSSVR